MAGKNNKKKKEEKEEKAPVIDLSEAQDIEKGAASDEDIMLTEEELLGITPTGGGGEGAAAAKPAKAGIPTTKKPLPASKFHIPNIVKQKYPDLIPLILETESMDDEEREYWFQILPIMTNEQVGKFREILISEKEQLAKLDDEYEKELNKINEKHLLEWQEFETKQKREELEKKEKVEEKEEVGVEEELLKKLEEL